MYRFICQRFQWFLALVCFFGGLTSEAQTGKNRALVLMGPKDGVELPKETLAGLNACTIETWVQWEDFVPFAQPWRFGNDHSSIGINTYRGNPTLQLFAYETDGTLHVTRIPSVLELHRWYHLAAVIEPDNGLQLYLNGMLVGETSQALQSVQQLAAHQPAMLGISPWKSNGHFKGLLDEFRIWDHSRTQAQIRDGMNKRVSGEEMGLRAWWNFDSSTADPNTSDQHPYILLGGAHVIESDWDSMVNTTRPFGVHGTVFDQNQKALVGAEVAIWHQGKMLNRVTSDAKGAYAIVVGKWDASLVSAELVVHHTKLGYRSKIPQIKPGESSQMNPILKPNYSLLGAVLNLNRQPMSEILVEAVPVSKPTSVEDFSQIPHAWAWTDVTGAFAFINLPEATYQLRVHTPEGFIGLKMKSHDDHPNATEALLDGWEDGTHFNVKSGIPIEGLDFHIPVFQRPRHSSFPQLVKLNDVDVLSMAFDKDQRLWIGFHNGGLAVGVNGKFAQVSPDLFPEKEVRALVHDGKRVWIGSEHGIYWQQGNEYSPQRPEVCRMLENEEIWSLTLGSNGDVWIGSNHGLYRYSPNHPDRLEVLEHFNTMWIRDILVEEDQSVWVATWGNGVFEQTDTGWHQWENAHGLIHRHVSSLMRDKEGRIWIGTDGGLSIFDPGNQTFLNKTMDSGLLDHFVTDIVEDSNGIVWVGSKGAGLMRVDGDCWTAWFDAGLLASVYVNQCLVDAHGDLWVGTDAGLNRLDYQHFKLYNIRKSILSLEGNHQGEKWIGTQGLGVFFFDGKKFHQITTVDGLAHDHVTCIFVDQDSDITLIGGPTGLTELRGNQVIDTYLTRGKPEGEIQEIRDIKMDSRQDLWLASWQKGLIRLNRDSRSVTRYGPDQGLGDAHPLSIALSSETSIWCGTDKGLFLLRDGRFEIPVAVEQLSDATIEDLEYAPDGETLWIVSNHGVFRLGHDQNLTLMSPDDNLRFSLGKQIRFSKKKNIAWLSLSLGGVGIYNNDQWSIVDSIKGLPKGHRAIQTIFVDDSDVLWGGTSTGIFRWLYTPLPPKIVATMKSENSRTSIGPNQPPAQPLKLLADRRLTLSFSSTSMVGLQHAYNYQYRFVENKDTTVSWENVSGGSSVDIVFDQPGQRTLEYRGLDTLGNTYDSNSLDIHVLPKDYYAPWYKRATFGAFLSVMAVSLGLFSLITLRKYFHGKRMLAQQKERYLHDLELRVSERTQDLEKARTDAVSANKAKSDFLSRMSHELRTPLNSIIGFSRLMQLSPLPSPMDKNATRIHKAGQHLLELIDEILDLSTIESRKIPINLESVRVEKVIVDVIDMIKPMAITHEVQVKWVDPPEAIPPALADRKRLQQVLINVAQNGIKYNRRGGRLSISANTCDSSKLEISVQDTGIGFSSEKLKRLFEPFDRLDMEKSGGKIEGTGLGLTISKKLVEFMGGQIRVTSEEGTGSNFIIELKQCDEKSPSLKEKDLQPANASSIGSIN